MCVQSLKKKTVSEDSSTKTTLKKPIWQFSRGHSQNGLTDSDSSESGSPILLSRSPSNSGEFPSSSTILPPVESSEPETSATAKNKEPHHTYIAKSPAISALVTQNLSSTKESTDGQDDKIDSSLTMSGKELRLSSTDFSETENSSEDLEESTKDEGEFRSPSMVGLAAVSTNVLARTVCKDRPNGDGVRKRDASCKSRRNEKERGLSSVLNQVLHVHPSHMGLMRVKTGKSGIQ